MTKNFDRESLHYHSEGKPGKVTVSTHKDCRTERALSLAYSPGVAAPCRKIFKNPKDVYKYTTKGNLVAVITNGTAVLGLGNIGPLASKPVMEGKGVLFKQFANIDVFDIELKTNSIQEFIHAVKALEPTFGGINLEDIKAPDCFEIEETLKKELSIPVFHDDQHGTAIICCAALINASKIAKKERSSLKVVFSGAGAASIACGRLFLKIGIKKENITMCDSVGVIYKGRKKGMNIYKEEFAIDTPFRKLSEAIQGADGFFGLSVPGILTPKMLKSMKNNPIVFAMANPNPEIDPALAKKVRSDVIIATGRSDFPNQVNNVLGFPSIFRGALDVEARTINEEMKLAAVYALANLTREDVPESVSKAYGGKHFHFGPNYIIPKPFDPRVIMHVAPAIAKAAMDSKVAEKPIKDLTAYRERLEAFQGFRTHLIRSSINQIKLKTSELGKEKPLFIFPEGESSKVLKALHTILTENIIEPILLGDKKIIQSRIKSLELDLLKKVPIFRPRTHPQFKKYVEAFYEKRQRKGITKDEAERLISNPYYFAAMAVKLEDADAFVSGATQNYADCLRPILQIIGSGKKSLASGLNIILIEGKILFFSDTTVNINPSAEEIAKIALQASEVAKYFNVKPRIAMLSFSNFTAKKENPQKMKRSCEILTQEDPSLIVDGEMQADTAVNPEILKHIFPFTKLNEGANIFIFPNLDSGNIAYKLVQQLAKGEVLGPLLLGIRKPCNIVQRTGNVQDFINMIVLTSLQVLSQWERKKKA